MAQSKKSSVIWLMLAGLLIGSLAAYLISRLLKKIQALKTTTPEPVPTDSATVGDLMSYYQMINESLKEAGYSDTMGENLMAQSMFETDIFTSAIFTQNNNMFGMRQPKTRQTTSLGDVGGYASYKSPADSIADMILYLSYEDCPKSFPDVTSYVAWLKSKNYFTDSLSTYQGGVKRELNTLNTELAHG